MGASTMAGLRAGALASVVLAAACSERADPAPSGPPGVVMSVIARDGAPAPTMRAVPMLGPAPDESARLEILKQVPSALPAPTATLLGTQTDEPASSAVASASASSAIAVHVSDVSVVEPSAAGIEKLLRASVYFDLVSRCRDKAGAILPPEAIHLHFVVSENGAIIASTITAKSNHVRTGDVEREAAERCMIRELSASSFRAPPASSGAQITVDADVPPAD